MKNKKLEVGDFVLVRKPANVDEYPEWSKNMDIFNNKIYEIITIRQNYRLVKLKGTGDWFFSSNWLIKIKGDLAKVLYEDTDI